MNKKQEALDKWQEAVDRKGILFRKVFGTSNGKKAFQELVDIFVKQSSKGVDPYDTYYKLGQRELVEYIRQIMENEPNER